MTEKQKNFELNKNEFEPNSDGPRPRPTYADSNNSTLSIDVDDVGVVVDDDFDYYILLHSQTGAHYKALCNANDELRELTDIQNVCVWSTHASATSVFIHFGGAA